MADCVPAFLVKTLNNCIIFDALCQLFHISLILITLPGTMFKYQKLADMLKTLLTKKTQLKTLLYNQPPLSAINQGVAYSNLSLIINNLPKFQAMHNELVQLMRKRGQAAPKNKYLLYVMVAELANTGKIVGGGWLKRIIMEYRSLLPQLETKTKINKQATNIRLCNHKHTQYEAYRQILAQYTPNTVIPNLYNLTHEQYSALLHQHPSIRQSPVCIIQSFSSNLPPYLLFLGLDTIQANLLRKFDVIDACAAPGNKTLQLGEYLGDRGKVFAFERDERRYGRLQANVAKYGGANIEAQLADFMQVLPTDPKYRRVKLIMLDPSCSGSGMLTNFTRDSAPADTPQQSLQSFVQSRYQSLPQRQQQRILALKSFQLQLLCHAARFAPQRITYSTCSIYCQQNQQVVEEFLAQHQEYRVKPVMSRQLGGREGVVGGFGGWGECVRVDPRGRSSDGFFVAVFQRRSKAKGQGEVN